MPGGEAEASLGIGVITSTPNRRDPADFRGLYLHSIEAQVVAHLVDAQVHAEVTEVQGFVAEDLPPDVGVQAIGTDHEIEGAGAAIAERDLDAVIGLSDRSNDVTEDHV